MCFASHWYRMNETCEGNANIIGIRDLSRFKRPLGPVDPVRSRLARVAASRKTLVRRKVLPRRPARRRPSVVNGK